MYEMCDKLKKNQGIKWINYHLQTTETKHFTLLIYSFAELLEKSKK